MKLPVERTIALGFAVALAMALVMIGAIGAPLYPSLWALLAAGGGLALVFVALAWLVSRQSVAEHRRVTAALRESEEHFRALAESAIDAIVTADGAGRLTAWNRSAERIFGYSAAEIVGQPILRLMPERYRELHRAGIERLNSGGETRMVGRTVELQGLRRDGSEFPLELSLAAWETRRGTFFTAIIRDITARKQVEAALQQAKAGLELRVQERTAELLNVNRSLHMLSDCNQVLVRATEESALLRDICRIIVEVGQYRFAWVGLAEADETKTIRPVAEAGQANGYLQTLSLAWADTERDAASTAIRTGQPVVIQHLRAEAPRRDEASQRSYHSTIALPLIQGQQTLGILRIYAAEPGAFNDDEVKLLTELASDLAYGIRALRVQAEHEQAKVALQASQARLAEIIESAMDAIITVDADQHIVLLNGAAERMFRCSAAEVVGQSLDRFIPERYRTQHRHHVRRFGETGITVRAKGALEPLSALRADGEQFPMEAAISQTEVAGQKLYTVIVRDITERKRAEAALQASERRFRALIENSGMLINLINREGVLIYVSPSSSRVVGYTPEEMVGRRVVDFLHPDEIEDKQHPFSRMLRQPGVTVKVERRVLHKDGSWRWVEGYSTNLIDDPAVGALVFNYRDVTDRKQAEANLQQHVARAEALAEAAQAIAAVTYDYQAVLDRIAQRTCELIGDLCVIRLYSDDRQWLVPVATYHPDPERLALMREMFASAPQAANESATGRALQNGQTMFFPVIEPAQVKALVKPEYWAHLDRYSLYSLMLVPMRSQGQVIGGLALSRDHPNDPYTTDDLSFLQELADRAALAITNARLFNNLQDELTQRQRAEEALRLREQHNHALLQLGKELEQADTPAQALGAALTQVKAILGYQTIWAYLIADDNAHMSLITIQGDIADRVVSEFPTLTVTGDAYLEEIISANDMVLVEDARTDPRTNKDIVAQLGNRTILNAPMALLDRKIGVLGTGSFGEEGVRVPTRAQLDFFSALASHVAVTLDRIRLLTDLQEAQAALRQFNAELEQRVVERTAQLAVANRELQQAKEDAEQARAAAEGANQAKSEFLSRMSHELRTPLNAVLGFAQVLGMDELDPRQKKSVTHIYEAGRHLLNLINEVLDIARIESGRLPVSPEPVHVSEIVQEVADVLHPLAAQRNIRLEVDRSAGCDRYIRADRQRIKQVLMNLISNAVKYNRWGGWVAVGCAETDGRLRIRIRDTGPGIDPEQIARLFTPFERLGAENSTVEGTGLGLALSKRLVEAMGGTVGVESEVGQGSTFWVELPVTDGPVERLQRIGTGPLAPSRAPGYAKTILYVEDNPSNFKLVEQILSHRPTIHLLAAGHGQLSLDMAYAHRPDLILLDLDLPDVHGSRVLTALQAEARMRAIPVVIISADATPHQIERLLAGGARDYLTKPLDVNRFLQLVDEILALEKDNVPDRAQHNS